MILPHGEIAWEIAPGASSAPATGNAPFAAGPSPGGSVPPLTMASTTLTAPPISPVVLPTAADRAGVESLSPAPKPAAPRLIPAAAAFAPPPILPVITLHGVEIHAIDEPTTIGHILREIEVGRGGFVVTPNLDHLHRCTVDVNFSALVAEADLVLADGMPLVWAARLQGTPLPARVAGSDLIWSLSAAAATRGRSVFMLGGAAGTADAAAQRLLERYPQLRIAGTYCPPIGFERDDAQVASIVQTLQQARPDIVYVALGSPKQEHLIDRIKRTLPQAWWIGVGISFSFVCGDVKRAPRWMQKTGLEWVHRLWQEPRRLFKRYLVVGIPFAVSLMTGAIARRIAMKLRAIDPRPSMRQSMRYWAHGHYRGNGNGSGNGKSNGNGNGNGHAVETDELAAMRMNGAASSPSVGLASAAPSLIDGLPAQLTTITSATSQAFIRAAEPVQIISLTARSDASSPAKALSRLRALVLLGGSVRQSQLTAATGRSILDLPVDTGPGSTILNLWLSHAAELAEYAGLENLPVQALVSRNSPEPLSAAARYRNSFRVMRDQSEFRGTGGVLRDLAHGFDEDDLVLVANAAQLLLDPLSVVAAALDHKRGDVALISHQDGTPSGVMLVRCKTLRLIPATGFVDMKEQALPTIAQQFDVRVMHLRRPSGLPIRTLSDYIGALRHYHRLRQGRPAMVDPLAEDWQPAFSIVEDGATVHPSAHVHDSIVLRGAVVETGAALVRSLAAPGAVAKGKATYVDQYISK